jgi:hypothetical protein
LKKLPTPRHFYNSLDYTFSVTTDRNEVEKSTVENFVSYKSNWLHYNYLLSENSNPSDKLKSFLIECVKWYRNKISPVLPPNCRFLPSCSIYSIEALEKYGSIKGSVLTAWRLIRCNPTGGSGYDPPVWPPPNYFAGSTSWMKWK